MAKKWRVKEGKHHSGAGATLKTYHKGEIVETDDDLDAKFPNKFELVHEAPEPVRASQAKRSAQEEDADEPVIIESQDDPDDHLAADDELEEHHEDAEQEQVHDDGNAGEDNPHPVKKKVKKKKA